MLNLDPDFKTKSGEAKTNSRGGGKGDSLMIFFLELCEEFDESDFIFLEDVCDRDLVEQLTDALDEGSISVAMLEQLTQSIAK